jgi:hypothetical protein
LFSILFWQPLSVYLTTLSVSGSGVIKTIWYCNPIKWYTNLRNPLRPWLRTKSAVLLCGDSKNLNSFTASLHL